MIHDYLKHRDWTWNNSFLESRSVQDSEVPSPPAEPCCPFTSHCVQANKSSHSAWSFFLA